MNDIFALSDDFLFVNGGGGVGVQRRKGVKSGKAIETQGK